MPLLDWKQRKELVDTLARHGLELTSFKPTLTDEVVRFDDDDGLSFFELRWQPDGFVASKKVGDSAEDRLGGPLQHNLAALSQWLSELYEFHNTPDRWSEVENELNMAQLAEGQENTPFTPDEQKQIEEIAAQVLAQAEQLGLPEAELHEVKNVLDYAADGAKWVRGRIDWTNLVAGYLFNKVADGTLSPETMRKLGHLLAVGFGALFGHPLPQIMP